jgi:hypothetical protein
MNPPALSGVAHAMPRLEKLIYDLFFSQEVPVADYIESVAR